MEYHRISTLSLWLRVRFSSATFTTSTEQTATSLADLMEQVALGNRESFAALYKATCLKLFGVILRILKRKALAEDIMQEVYIKIWERSGDFNAAHGTPMTWMITIARNRALDEIRRGIHTVSSSEIPEFDNIAGNEPDALTQLQTSEDYLQLTDCLKRIDEPKRSMIILAYQEGMSREALAQKYTQPLSTIKTWIRRSLQMLKECLQS